MGVTMGGGFWRRWRRGGGWGGIGGVGRWLGGWGGIWRVWRGLRGNLRTRGRMGFRGDRVDVPALEKFGWRHFHEAGTVNPSPHFESGLWACYLWAYARTGEGEFLETARRGIGAT